MEGVGGVLRARGWCGLRGGDGGIFAFCLFVVVVMLGRKLNARRDI